MLSKTPKSLPFCLSCFSNKSFDVGSINKQFPRQLNHKGHNSSLTSSFIETRKWILCSSESFVVKHFENN